MISRGAAILALAAFPAACSHDLGAFQRGGDAGGDTADTTVDVAPDAPDTGLDAPEETQSDVPVDVPPDVADSADTSTDDADAADTSGDAADTGPPAPEVSCTLVGPPETTCISASPVTLGAINEPVCGAGGCPAETPEVSVNVSQFWIDDHEVTVKRFRAWWNMSSRPWPTSGGTTGATTYFKSAAKDLKWRAGWPTAPSEPSASAGCTWHPTDTTNDDRPLNCVDWFTALGFCLSEGKRLPTEAEWELVASGLQDRLFPWSLPSTEHLAIDEAELDCAHALRGTCAPQSTPMASTVWGRTRHGVWNMAGSFAEWVLDGHSPSWPPLFAGTIDPITDPSTVTGRVARGGSYLSPVKDLRAAARSATPALTAQDVQIGFRCAKRL
ncbi:MAG: SUMF1/EgtB/PvdO family nonheme iron enzyme [Deltaproteobacteria bacterium]|nr:SUMF1/EgtB/PvdO family nonheme iron enzyme [Deltaproteobacteria bacterium]